MVQAYCLSGSIFNKIQIKQNFFKFSSYPNDNLTSWLYGNIKLLMYHNTLLKCRACFTSCGFFNSPLHHHTIETVTLLSIGRVNLYFLFSDAGGGGFSRCEILCCFLDVKYCADSENQHKKICKIVQGGRGGVCNLKMHFQGSNQLFFALWEPQNWA